MLVKHIIQALIDACTQLFQLVNLGTVALLNKDAGTDKLPEQTHIVPYQYKHNGECYEVSQSPPESCENPQQNNGDNQTDRYRNEYTYSDVERTVEHMVLNQLFEEDFGDDEQQACRDNRD